MIIISSFLFLFYLSTLGALKSSSSQSKKNNKWHSVRGRPMCKIKRENDAS